MMLVTKYSITNTPRGDNAMRPLLFTIKLKCYAILEDGDFAIAILFIPCGLSTGYSEHLIDEFRY